MRGYENLIGNALAGYPGGYGYAAPVFGAGGPDGSPVPMPGGPMMAAPGAPGFPLGASCWGDPAVVDPSFQPNRLFAAAYGAQCGPLLQQLPMFFEDVGCIDDGEEVDIRAFPQYPSKLVRLFLAPSQASSFLITGIFAGITPCMVSQGVAPGEMLLPDSENAIFNSVTLYINQPFILRVKNISGAQAKCNPGAFVLCISGGQNQIYGRPIT